MLPIYIDYRRPVTLPSALPEGREDGYNGPVNLPCFADDEEWNFEEWLRCYPVRSTDDKGIFGGFDQVDDGFDQVDDVKPISLHAAHQEVNFIVDLIDAIGLPAIVQLQLHRWNQDVANAFCSLSIPLFGYDKVEKADENSWKQVFKVYFPEFDLVQLEEIKAAIVDSDVGVDVWHNSSIPGRSWMSWVVRAWWLKSPLLNYEGRWVARPEYDMR
jgi:hypothetical protein